MSFFDDSIMMHIKIFNAIVLLSLRLYLQHSLLTEGKIINLSNRYHYNSIRQRHYDLLKKYFCSA
jgi:hypothetical protein